MNYYMMKAKLKNPKVLTTTVAAVTFWLGLAVGHATTSTPEPTPVESAAVDMINLKNLTAETCQTDTECHIAEALQFYADYQFPMSIPIVEPVDCSAETGKAKTACERSNKKNAGKPAMYPTICDDVEQKEC